jgi:hypothetical protein
LFPDIVQLIAPVLADIRFGWRECFAKVFTWSLFSSCSSFLGYLIQPKAIDVNTSSDSESREKEHTSSRISDAISNSIFSIGDLFKDVTRDGHKSVKFPEKLLKVLDAKLASIAMGKDAA